MANGDKGRSGGTAGSGKEPLPSYQKLFIWMELLALIFEKKLFNLLSEHFSLDEIGSFDICCASLE